MSDTSTIGTESIPLRMVKGTLLVTVFLLPLGCQQKMADQPSFKPLDPTGFFPDQRSARQLVPGTIARGHLRTNAALYRGTRSNRNPEWVHSVATVGLAGADALGGVAAALAEPEEEVKEFPMPVTAELVERGRERYMIYCVVCHDPAGTGSGKIVERGYTRPPSYHIERLRQAPVGHFFRVMTEGYGSMPDYREQVPVHDRWAIAAYIRALQLSQHFPQKNLTPEMRDEMQHQESVGGDSQ